MADKGVTVLLGPVGQLLDEVLNLFPAGLSECLGAAEVDGVGLYEFGVELVLADDLAEAVTDLGASAGAMAVTIHLRKLLAGVRNCPDFLDRAETDSQTVIKNAPKNSEAHYALGVAFEKLGNLESAEGEWREALRLRPDFLDAQRALAAAAMRQGDMGTLQEAATQMIRLQPASPEGYALRALSYINRKQYGEAEKGYS